MDDKAKEKPKLKVLQLVKDKFMAAMDNFTYHLEDKSQKYDCNAARRILKWSKGLTVQMKSQTSGVAEPKTVLSFLNDLKLTCDKNGEHKGVAMWLIHLLMKKPASAVLKGCPCLKPMKKRQKMEGTLARYFQVVNYLLPSYLMDNVIAETDVEMNRSKQPPNINVAEYS